MTNQQDTALLPVTDEDRNAVQRWCDETTAELSLEHLCELERLLARHRVEALNMTETSIDYWKAGTRIIEKCLAKATKADPQDAPVGLVEHDADVWFRAQASAYQHALEMMGFPAEAAIATAVARIHGGFAVGEKNGQRRYVLLGNDGKFYSAESLNGPWQEWPPATGDDSK